MENKLTPELLEKAKQAKTAEELIALAKENGTEMTEESAKAYFDQLHKTGELADEELGNISGGACHARDGRMITTVLNYCSHWQCDNDRDISKYSEEIFGGSTYVCQSCGTVAFCKTCALCSYEKGLWLCNSPCKKKD